MDKASVYGTEGEKPQTSNNKALTNPEHTNLASYLAQNPDLKQIIEIWPELPERIKVAIKALIAP